MQNARGCEIQPICQFSHDTCDRNEQVETPERVYKNWTLHDNHISPKQPKIVNKESKL